MRKNKLLVPEAESFMASFKEEFAHEFGVFHSVQEIDAKAKDMTSILKKDAEKKCDKKN